MRREELGKHNVHTHFPKDRNCEICKRTKITRSPCRRRKGEAVLRAENFGDFDNNVLSDNCESRNNHRYAFVVQDLATQWPCKNKTSQETQRSLQKFLEPERKPKVIHIDNSLEFGKACEDLSWNHCTSTPHRSEANGIVERAVRRVKEGGCCCRIVAFRSEWKWVGRFGGMWICSAKHSRSVVWWENFMWGMFWKTMFKEQVTLIFLENQKELFHNLMTHFRMPVKLWTISGPCREALYTAITLNPEPSFSRREKNHSQCH